ncbi:hypothetical protein DPMN_182180 [Dreissena polymorpha]|uniref:Uncharacterized protein n=1 Tax=Dreissena polymorpha TaxID=45954 RepID=A0A9D4DFT4_DREPO|nr:hypothetical protein DPMN_182180 [Dreissena polymorpha]
MNLLTKFHEDQTIKVASRVLTRLYYSHIRKNAPPLGSHVYEANVTLFKLIQDIIETNILTKFNEEWTINVASRELTRQGPTTYDGQRAITKAHHKHIVLRRAKKTKIISKKENKLPSTGLEPLTPGVKV